MNLQKIQKEKKGISPIIATLLLILIAIAAGVIVYAYVVGFVGGSTSGQPTNQVVLSIDQATGNHSTVTLIFYARNTGSVAASFNGSNIYITSPNGTINQLSYANPAAPTAQSCEPTTEVTGTFSVCQKVAGASNTAVNPLDAGSTAVIQLYFASSGVKLGSTYSVKLVLSDGSTLTGSVKNS